MANVTQVKTRNGIPQEWVRNAVLTSGRLETTGAKATSATGAIDPVAMARVPLAGKGPLPKLYDLDMLNYLANLGYIEVHQDPTALAGMRLFKNGATGFYIGLGLMKHRISAKSLLAIREMLTPENKKGYDAAVSMHIGRVVSPVATPREAIFGVDQGDVDKAAGVAEKLGEGDYGGAAEDVGGDIAKGAVAGATVAAATGTIVAAGAAIGTAIPIPVVGTAAGAAVGAAVAGAIALGHVIFDSKPAFSQGDYDRMQQRQKESGAVELVGGVPPDLYGACRYKDGSVSGGDWPFAGTWNHEIRDWDAYKRNWDARCKEVGGTAEYNRGPGARGVCAFPDGFRTDGGEFWRPEWPADKRTEYEADQAARKVQYTNLGSYVNGLKEIDKLVAQADAAMRKPGATVAQRNVWMGKIGDAFEKIYKATGQDKYAPLNRAGFIADTQKRVFTPTVKPALLPVAKAGSGSIAMRALAAQAKIAKINPQAMAGMTITQGMVGGAPEQKAALMTSVAENPQAKAGAAKTIEAITTARESILHKILKFLHLVK